MLLTPPFHAQLINDCPKKYFIASKQCANAMYIVFTDKNAMKTIDYVIKLTFLLVSLCLMGCALDDLADSVVSEPDYSYTCNYFIDSF